MNNKRPKPNEKCECGSGKKFKKCCYSRIMKVGEKDVEPKKRLKHPLAMASMMGMVKMF
jgi:hypothetical protein